MNFGGFLDIEEYRKYTITAKKLIDCILPPMISYIPKLEEINKDIFNKSDNQYKYVPLDYSRIKRFNDKLKLKRSKPLTEFKNTLDHTMNLQYKSN